ncbi:MAG: hypothetical protein LBG26_00625 [Treponema sp.]|jgi:hypothetical protein|nr:hypothetical protein [Treponema sp.]
MTKQPDMSNYKEHRKFNREGETAIAVSQKEKVEEEYMKALISLPSLPSSTLRLKILLCYITPFSFVSLPAACRIRGGSAACL